jgi:hypothetical protein
MESETISTSDDSTKDLRILILMKLIKTALMAVPKKK